MTRRIRVRHVSSGERLGGCVMTHHDSRRYKITNSQWSLAAPRLAMTTHACSALAGVLQRLTCSEDLLVHPHRLRCMRGPSADAIESGLQCVGGAADSAVEGVLPQKVFA